MGFLRFRRTWVERAFWKSEREAQLARFETLCSKLAELYAVNGEICEAAAFAERAHRAAALQTAGWSQSDLNELGGQFPDGGWWLNPKAVDYGAPRLRGKTRWHASTRVRRRPLTTCAQRRRGIADGERATRRDVPARPVGVESGDVSSHALGFTRPG